MRPHTSPAGSQTLGNKQALSGSRGGGVRHARDERAADSKAAARVMVRAPYASTAPASVHLLAPSLTPSTPPSPPTAPHGASTTAHDTTNKQSLFGFGPSSTVDVKLEGQDERPRHTLKGGSGKEDEAFLIYQREEPVRGVVVIDVPPGRSLDHLGIKVEMIGQIGAWLGG